MELDRRQVEEENRIAGYRNDQLEEQLRHAQSQLLETFNHEQDTIKWKEIVEKLEFQRQREINEFRQILEESRHLQIDSQGSLTEAERTAYNTQIKQLSMRVGELMESLKIKESENNTLRSTNVTHLREKGEIKSQLQLTSQSAEVDTLKR